MVFDDDDDAVHVAEGGHGMGTVTDLAGTTVTDEDELESRGRHCVWMECLISQAKKKQSKQVLYFGKKVSYRPAGATTQMDDGRGIKRC